MVTRCWELRQGDVAAPHRPPGKHVGVSERGGQQEGIELTDLFGFARSRQTAALSVRDYPL